ncbi:hypothetical protein BJY01DRAFT_226789 [Aspergillus pseudoustus]|uniref:Zn(2)-C6 fungal-type domain-containing protein n=1 Tax=Aspergillus pseudoustus TaxID=1810923 RepID=A0ABR4ITD9_9EURO
MHRRRPHKKSKNGCLVCRERKIKCDELKPRCTNCIRFEVPCSFDLEPPKPVGPSPTEPVAGLTKRGRGRPRKQWGLALGRLETQPQPLPLPQSQPQVPGPSSGSRSPTALGPSPPGERSPSRSSAPSLPHLNEPASTSCRSLNVADIELLLHFTTHTGPAFASPNDTSTALFWSRNVPQIGLSCHTVLHLILAVSGHHLAYLATTSGENNKNTNTERRTRYAHLAQTHGSLGLAGVTKALATIDASNCGAIYTAALLVSYCTFASGPSGPDDLLVCNVGNGEAAPHRWMSVVQGVRLIAETFEPSVLYAGLVAPLRPREGEPSTKIPAYMEEGYPRIEWEEPLHRLRDLITSRNEPNTTIYLGNYEQIEAIYEATYGKPDGTFDVGTRNKFIFIWLYVMADDYVACLQRREPISLLLLAYYALLLTTLKRDWYIHCWPRHILSRIREILHEDYLEWLVWPLQQANLPVGRRSGWLTQIMS